MPILPVDIPPSAPPPRRIGRVKFTRGVVMEQWPKLGCFFMHFVPLRIDVDLASDVVEYTGFSSLFRVVPEGSEIPVYEVGFAKIGDATLVCQIK